MTITETIEKSDHLIILLEFNYAIQHPTFETRLQYIENELSQIEAIGLSLNFVL